MLVLITAFGALGGFLFGYDLGLIGPALITYSRTNDITTNQKEAVVGAAKLGSVFGTFVGGAVMLHYGRRTAIAVDSMFFIVGPAVMAASAPVWGLILGRLLVGIGIGISAVVVPAYLGEVAPAKARGQIVEMYELLVCFGMVAAQLADLALDLLPSSWSWRVMFGMPAIFGAVLLLATYFLPESPRWLVVEGKLDAALAVIHQVYTNSKLPSGVHQSRDDVEHELMMLWSAVERERVDCIARREQLVNKFRRKRRGGRHKAYRPLVPFWRRRRGLDEVEERQSVIETATAPVLGSNVPRSDMHTEEAGPTQLNGGSLREASMSPSPAVVHVEMTPASAASLALPADQPLHEIDIGADHTKRPSEINGVSGVNGGPADGDGNGDGDQAGPGAAMEHTRTHPRRNFFVVFGYMLMDVWLVSQGLEKHAFWLALALAVLNQATASTAIINYAPDVLEKLDVTNSTANTLLTVTVTASKFVGIIVAMLLVDVWGRRPLLILGSGLTCVFMVLAAVAFWVSSVALMVVAMDAFIFSFSMSWAGIFWVLMSELFSMSAKAPAVSAATAMLFITGAVVDFVFLTVLNALSGASFIIYATVAFVAGVVVFVFLPETKGRSLADVQQLLRGNRDMTGSISQTAANQQQPPPGARTTSEQSIVVLDAPKLGGGAIPVAVDAESNPPATSQPPEVAGQGKPSNLPSLKGLVAIVKPKARTQKFERMEEEQWQ